MNTLIASVLLASTMFSQQHTITPIQQKAPEQFVVEMNIYENADSSFRLNGEPLVDRSVSEAEAQADIESDDLKLKSSPMMRTLTGLPARVGMGSDGVYEGYRVLVVPDGDELLVSFRHMTWRHDEDSAEIYDKHVLKAIATLLQPGGTLFVRLTDDSVVSVTVHKVKADSYGLTDRN